MSGRIVKPARQIIALWCVLIGAIAALPGCQLAGVRVVPSPMSFHEQQQEILKIVPFGTPRKKVAQNLAEAGIEGRFGVNHLIFYCDIWNRKSGERWHMNVALLFDQSGRLYRTRQGEAETGVVLGERRPGSDQIGHGDKPTVAQSATPVSPPTSAVPGNAAKNNRSPRRDGRRTPFGNDTDLK